MYKIIYRVTDGFTCVLSESLLCGDTHTKQSVSKGLGTSGPVCFVLLVVLLLCREKHGCGFISLAHPAPAGTGSPEPSVHGYSRALVTVTVTPSLRWEEPEARLPVLRTKAAQG